MRWREYVNLCYRERARKSVFVSERETERGREGGKRAGLIRKQRAASVARLSVKATLL